MTRQQLIHYQAFGLELYSDLDLVHMKSNLQALTQAEECRVDIAAGEVSPSGLENAPLKIMYCHAESGRVWFRIPGIARFLIEQGRRIVYQADMEEGALDSSNNSDIALFILSHCVPAICVQRNCLILRASAVRIGDHCALICGTASSGKSTYAAALHNRGFDVVSDEVCVIDEQQRVLPGYPFLKVWRDILNHLHHDPRNFSPVRSGLEKYLYPLEDGFASKPVPVKSIFLAKPSFEPGWRHEFIRGYGKAKILEPMVYRPRLRAALRLEDLTKQFMSLIMSTNMNSITWSYNGRGARISAQLQFMIDQMECE